MLKLFWSVSWIFQVSKLPQILAQTLTSFRSSLYMWECLLWIQPLRSKEKILDFKSIWRLLWSGLVPQKSWGGEYYRPKCSVGETHVWIIAEPRIRLCNFVSEKPDVLLGVPWMCFDFMIRHIGDWFGSCPSRGRGVKSAIFLNQNSHSQDVFLYVCLERANTNPVRLFQVVKMGWEEH